MASVSWFPRRLRPRALLITVAVVVALLVGVAVVLWTQPVFMVSEVEVTGNRHLSVEQVRESSGVTEGQNLVRVDEEAAATAVAQLEWVESVTVSRSLPATVSIAVTEHTPVLFRREGDQPLLIDSHGQAFAYGDPPEGTVEATGEAVGDRDTMKSLVEAVSAMDPGVRAQVASVFVPSKWEIEFRLADGRVVYWGSLEGYRDKALAMRTVLTREGQRWDVSNPRLVTVR
ncbi:FtsQ-type POTRA domain-containing protein [Corynebacterium sp. zg-331]|uniref:cell division protein FtsQ/DivIB n=1 Tax=unclassified Corynebacterium TaxID=2624378 RepID=UPI00128C7079|nr:MULTISPECIES: FtsQ-type POTRA domain-containing protein [unclassified Corynebacterium]MBC3185225.1 FtsQ-type POTRA domain-containing protein [Corynebacterium sp. zg-331]MPV51723.1 FtsQ-type POTRA domain-containing protein [Corynebacterium sp. zg331]